MAYNKTNWENAPSTDTPINASNLNKIEEGIYQNSLSADSNTTNIGTLTNLETPNKTNLVSAINSMLPIDISNKFEKTIGTSNINTLIAYYYPLEKKVELYFWISGLSSTNDWKNIITITDSNYYPKSNFYYPSYSTNAEFGAVGIDANTQYFKGFKNTIFGGTFIYYVN